MTNRINSLYGNPIKFFGLITILLSLILLYRCQFHLPDFFTDKSLAEQIAQTVSPGEVSRAVSFLFNSDYDFFNGLFHFWGWAVTLFIFSCCFKVNEFRKFKKLDVFNKPLFIYLWINLSYIIWSVVYVTAYMIDLEKWVYNGAADSMGIPLFSMIGTLVFFAVVHYPYINILSYITFNTKIRRRFYNFLWAVLLLFGSVITIDCLSWKFTYFHLILDLYYFIWFMLIIYAIGFNKNKVVSK